MDSARRQEIDGAQSLKQPAAKYPVPGVRIAVRVAAAALLSATATGVVAYEVTESFSIDGTLAGAYQHDAGQGRGGGAMPFQPELTFRPTERDEFSAKFGFAAGNGINDKTPFTVSPWGADLEDDVKDINGSGRDYLLTAWYKHTFTFDASTNLAVTGGLIDSTEYLFLNVYAADEYTQFMNEAFVNEASSTSPSYDLGGALELTADGFSANAVVMNVHENEDGNEFWYYGLQLGYAVETTLGTGNYRLIVNATSKDFLDPQDLAAERLLSLGLSFDQALGDTLGMFMQLAVQADDAAIDFDAAINGGLFISGKAWGRPRDNAGIGLAYLDGGNTGIDRVYVFEAYARLVLGKHTAITADIQYMDEKRTNESFEGWIPGIRAVVQF